MSGKKSNNEVRFSNVPKCIFLIMAFISLGACTPETPDVDDPVIVKPDPDDETEYVGSIPYTVTPDVLISQRATKISQLTGDYDRHMNIPTLSQSFSRYRIEGIDLGVPFEDGDTTWVLFGDTWGPKGGALDAIGYTLDKNPEQGLKLDFVADKYNVYQPINIPGIRQAAFEVPNEGIIIDNTFYVWHTTDNSPTVAMGRNVLASASRENAVKGQYTLLYDYSVSKFINVSVVKVNNADWDLLPDSVGESLIVFGSGVYRESHVYLACHPVATIRNRSTIRYFAGMKDGKPLWNKKENDAKPIFALNNPGVGELSVSYNKFIKKWILMYNHGDPRGINLRTSNYPWGPWSREQVVFQPWDDGGYCHFMHTSWEVNKCDNVHNPGRENDWGGEYGPYQFEHFATGDSVSTTIYFTMSTWNPYETILMKAGLKKK